MKSSSPNTDTAGQNGLRLSYRFWRGVLRLFTPRMETVWEVPYDGGPAVFIPNHLGALGPIDMCVHFSERDQIRPWVNDNVLHFKGLPDYIRNDNWWKKGSKLEPLLNVTVPYLVTAIMPPLMRTVPGIPVFHDARAVTTIRCSVRAFAEGYSPVVFAQLPRGYGEKCPGLHSGWMSMLPLIHHKTGIAPKIYPVYIDHKAHKINVGKPVAFDPERKLDEQKDEMLAVLSPYVNQ